MRDLVSNIMKLSKDFSVRELKRLIPFAGIFGLFFVLDETTFKLVLTMLGMLLMIGLVVHINRRILLYFVNLGELYESAKNGDNNSAKMFIGIIAFYCVQFICGVFLLS